MDGALGGRLPSRATLGILNLRKRTHSFDCPAILATTTRGRHMADQTVRIENLPSSGSAERVAFDLFATLYPYLGKTQTFAERANQALSLYAECRKAVRGSTFDTSQLK
jgi:hypothetical protein